MKFTSSLTLFALVALAGASDWDTYPSVAKTATINGFADPIYDKLPSCAKECVKLDTDITPCPYWDTGCFCVMANWSGVVAECFAESCSGTDVESATSLALSLCSSVGANTWMMPASVSSELESAVAKGVDASTTGISSSITSSTLALSDNSSSSASVTAAAYSASDNSFDFGNSSTSAGVTSSSSSEDGANTMVLSTSFIGVLLLGILSMI